MRRNWLSTSLLVLICSIALSQELPLSTNSDSARYYYLEGWRVILDEGQYSLSEVYFRRAANLDPDFLMNLCQVARLSSDQKERNMILKKVQQEQKQAHPDEQLLLANFIELIHLTNLRDLGDSSATKAQAVKALTLAETNLGKLVRKYPGETHHGVEYIEVIHYNHGAQAALDSLKALSLPNLSENTFILGYQVVLLSELGEFAEAEAFLQKLKAAVPPTVPKYWVTRGNWLELQNRHAEAGYMAEKALALDPGNIDAQRLKARTSQR